MIDWIALAWNALWIVALALAISVVSWSAWEASQHAGTSWSAFRSCLGAPAQQAALSLAGVLFCLGLAGSSTGWQRLVWAGLGLGFTVQLLLGRRKK